MYLTYKGLHCNVCGVTAAVRVCGARRNMCAVPDETCVRRPWYARAAADGRRAVRRKD